MGLDALISETPKFCFLQQVDKIAIELEASKDDTRIVVHIDMDCFFAAVEIRDNPSLGYYF